MTEKAKEQKAKLGCDFYAVRSKSLAKVLALKFSCHFGKFEFFENRAHLESSGGGARADDVSTL